MRRLKKDNSTKINITNIELIHKVNDKCLNRLGYKVIDSIVKTTNYKTQVRFMNGKLLNFCTFNSALQYLNMTYNLKLVVEIQKKQKVQKTLLDLEEVSESNSSIAISKIKTFIEQFKKSNNNIKLNKITLSDYIESQEWKNFKFIKKDTDVIINYLSDTLDLHEKTYVEFLNKFLNLHYK